MKFEDAPLVPTPPLFREAKVSPVRGKSVQTQLTQAGRINPVSTPTGRDLLTPPHARILFEELTRLRK
jgi:hypothetical protein